MTMNNNTATTTDNSLNHYMGKIYLWMFFGMLVSAASAEYLMANPGLIRAIAQSSGLFLGLLIAQLVCVFAFGAIYRRSHNASLLTSLYVLYSALTGITLAVVCLLYTQQQVVGALMATGVSFVAVSAYGFITKRDLGFLGTFCYMGLFGLLGTFLLSFLFPSLMGTVGQMTTGAIGVIVFSGLTAYKTQRIKAGYLAYTQHGVAVPPAIGSALDLYISFINLFLSFLRLSSR